MGNNTKEKIRTVSVDLFFRKGYFATSISEIARGSTCQTHKKNDNKAG